MASSSRSYVAVRKALLLLCATASLLLFSGSAHGFIHEDEQGLRDWTLSFVGDVSRAAYYPVQENLPVAFVVSAEGAVASLSTELRWRQLLDEPAVCVGASKQTVVAATRSGGVYLFDPWTGAIKLSLQVTLPAGATVTDCTISGKDRIGVAAIHASNGLRYNFVASDIPDYQVSVAPATYATESTVTDARIAGKSLWISYKGGCVEAIGGSEVRHTHTFDGEILSTASTGEALIATDVDLIVVRQGAAQQTTKCAKCRGALVTGAADGSYAGFVGTRFDGKAKKFVTVSSGAEGEVSYAAGTNFAPSVVAATLVHDYLAVLTVPSNGHLLLLTGTSSGVDATVNTIVWERFEGIALPVLTAIAQNSKNRDHFAFNHNAVVLSRHGVLYSIPVSERGKEIRVIADIGPKFQELTNARSLSHVHFKRMKMASPQLVSIIASVQEHIVARVVVNVITGAIVEAKAFTNPLLVGSQVAVLEDMTVDGSVGTSTNIFVVKKDAGLVEGYEVRSSSKQATPLWSVQSPYPFVAFASGDENELNTAIASQLRVYPNKTSKVKEVRRKYPTRNVLVVAHYEPSVDELTTLVITAIDTITGSTLGYTRHRNVEGSVHIAVVEHMVVYYFMDAERMRHCIGVWEMFEDEITPLVQESAGATIPLIISSFVFQNKRTFSSYATRAPVVVPMVYGAFGGDISAMGVTTSLSAIARKNIILAYTSGRVASLDLRMLLAKEAIEEDKAAKEKAPPETQIVPPSASFLTHRHRLAMLKSVVTEPTDLESSCHVLVAGLDLFYVRTSAGKAFDLLNSDFNKSLLMMVTGAFCVFSVVAKYLLKWKQLNQMWN